MSKPLVANRPRPCLRLAAGLMGLVALLPADAALGRRWVQRDGQVAAEGVLLDVRHGQARIALEGTGEILALDLEELSLEDRRYVAQAVDVARRFGVVFEELLGPASSDAAAPEAAPAKAASDAAEARPEHRVVSLRLKVPPSVVTAVRVLGDDPRCIVVEQKLPDGMARLGRFDGTSGELLSTCVLPEDATLLDVLPGGRLAAVHLHERRSQMHAVEVRSLVSGKTIWSLPERWRAGVFSRSFHFVDEQTILEHVVVDREGLVCRAWRIPPEGSTPFSLRALLRQLLGLLADLGEALVRQWNALGWLPIKTDAPDRLRAWGRQVPLREWRLVEPRLAFARATGQTIALAYSGEALQQIDLATGQLTDQFLHRLDGRRLHADSLAVTPTGDALAFLTQAARGRPAELVVVGRDGTLKARAPVPSDLSGLTSGPLRCLPLEPGYWALLRQQDAAPGEPMAGKTAVHVFDEQRGLFIWTYTLDAALLAREAGGRRLWWATPDPESTARTLVTGLPLPDPRAQHFAAWAVTTDEPVLAEAATVTCFSKIDESAFRAMTSQQRRQIGQGIPPILNSLQLTETPQGDFTILQEIVRQDRGGAAGVYNVVSGISIFDRQRRLLCRNVQLHALEDSYGYCGDLDRLSIDWSAASSRLWEQAVRSFPHGRSERLLRGLGAPTGIGATQLPVAPETLSQMLAWTPGAAEQDCPLTDLAQAVAQDASQTVPDAERAPSEPPLARAFVRTWQAQVDPPPMSVDWRPREGLEIPFDEKTTTGLITYPHVLAPFVAIMDHDIRCYDLRSGAVTGHLPFWLQLSCSALDPAGQRIAFRTTEEHVGGVVELFAFDRSPPAETGPRKPPAAAPWQRPPAPVRVSLEGKSRVQRLFFTARNQIVTTFDDSVLVADAGTGRRLQDISYQLEPPATAPADVSPGGCYLAHLHSRDRSLDTGSLQVRLVDLRNGIEAGVLACPATMEKPSGSGPTYVGWLAFSPDGQYLALLSRARILCWDLATQTIVCDVDVEEDFQRAYQRDPLVQLFAIQQGVLHWLPDGSGWLALGCLLVTRATGEVRIADIEQRTEEMPSITGFTGRLVPGPEFFRAWAVKEGRQWKMGTMFAEIRTLD